MDVIQPCIKIQVHTKYIEEQSNPELQRYVFAYTITIKNLSQQTVQLISRRWLITDSNGKQMTVEGDGVVTSSRLFQVTMNTPTAVGLR